MSLNICRDCDCVMKITMDQALWLADQIELGQWRDYSTVLPDVRVVIAELREGVYSEDI